MYETPQKSNTLRFVCISDTHNKTKDMKLPPGDVLVHCGDFTRHGTLKEMKSFNKWMKEQPFKYKVLIPGNHDFCVCPVKCSKDYEKNRKLLDGCTHFLIDELIEIEGIKIYGTPLNPEFHDMAFNKSEKELEEHRKSFPQDIDILLTHNPPYGYRDVLFTGERIGEKSLTKAIERIKPKYSIFGHIHEARGVCKNEFTTFINCAVCTLRYQADNEAIVFDYPTKK